MKDRQIASIARNEDDDGPPTEVTATAPSSRATSSPATTDRTVTLVAAILGLTAAQAAQRLQSLGGIEAMAFASEAELRAVSIPAGRAKLIHSAFELARMSMGARPRIGQRLRDSADVAAHLRARLCGLAVEEFWAIAVDVRHRVILDTMLARGNLTGVEVHPRDVFRALIKVGAAAVIFCHNHPSGDPEASRGDVELTARLRQVGDLCGIAVLDHVIVGAEGVVSLCERGWR